MTLLIGALTIGLILALLAAGLAAPAQARDQIRAGGIEPARSGTHTV